MLTVGVVSVIQSDFGVIYYFHVFIGTKGYEDVLVLCIYENGSLLKCWSFNCIFSCCRCSLWQMGEFGPLYFQWLKSSSYTFQID